MSTTATSLDAPVSPGERLEVLFDEIVAESDRDGLWGATGARSITSLVAWETGVTPPSNHHQHRRPTRRAMHDA